VNPVADKKIFVAGLSCLRTKHLPRGEFELGFVFLGGENEVGGDFGALRQQLFAKGP
jgi:hypothetical protein